MDALVNYTVAVTHARRFRYRLFAYVRFRWHVPPFLLAADPIEGVRVNNQLSHAIDRAAKSVLALQ